MVTKKVIVWKLARGYCLCQCKTFSLVPDLTECIKNITEEFYLKSTNIICQGKTTNIEEQLHP